MALPKSISAADRKRALRAAEQSLERAARNILLLGARKHTLQSLQDAFAYLDLLRAEISDG